MRQKYKSETTKRGNGSTHDKAVDNVIEFLETNNYNCVKEWWYRFEYEFNKANGLRDDYDHKYDLAVFREIDRWGNGNITSELFLLIEVDGEKHRPRSPMLPQNQKRNDQTAERYASNVLHIPLVRLKKEECLGTKEDRTEYFKKKLAKYIK